MKKLLKWTGIGCGGLFAFFILLSILGALFGGNSTEPATQSAPAASGPPPSTAPVAPTKTAAPGNTPIPTKTTAPTRTPIPTRKPVPTATPRPPAASPVQPSQPALQTGVTSGAFCSSVGQKGETKTGLPMVCTRLAGEDRARWRAQ